MKLFHGPSEIRDIAEYHALHGLVIPFSTVRSSCCGTQSHRSGDGFLEPFPSLPERDEMMGPDRICKGRLLTGHACKGAEVAIS